MRKLCRMADKRALVCEDDAAIRSLVKTVVSREGFDVDMAEDGGKGIEKMKEGCYDLVILDLMMPRVDGFAVVDFLKKGRPSNLKRVIVMSAATSVLRGEFPETICTLLPKPCDISQLVTAVRGCARQCDDAAAAQSG